MRNIRKITGDVIAVQKSGQIVINRGIQDRVEPGQRYMTYMEGESLTDPETGEDLGRLESICGYGTVSEVRQKEAILIIDTIQGGKPSPAVDTHCHVRRIALTSPRSLFSNSPFYLR